MANLGAYMRITDVRRKRLRYSNLLQAYPTPSLRRIICRAVLRIKSSAIPPLSCCRKSLLDYGEEDEAYLYLDPKLREMADPGAARSRGPPREVIVFMIGGGCYSEYQNLQVRRGNTCVMSSPGICESCHKFCPVAF